MITEITEIIEIDEPLNEIVFKKFLNDELKVKEVKSMESNITERFNYIVHKIAELTGNVVYWFDYDNEGGDEDSGGYFDTDLYKDCVGYTGEFHLIDKQSKKFHYSKYDCTFPTSWFYENFEEQLKNENDNFVSEQKKSHIAFVLKK